jgi:putative autoinducer-2 (AI-2) aldolase
VVIAGGKKQPENEAFQMAYDAISAGAIGVDMGRNIFQSSHPVNMIKAVNAIVHQNMTPKEAFEIFQGKK